MKTSYNNTEDLRIIKTKKAIIKAFWDLLYEKNIEDISITSICQLAMVNRSTFYLHFEDKNQLLVQSIYDAMFKVNQEAIELCKTDSVKEYYEVIGDLTFNLLTKNKERYRTILSHNDVNLFIEPAQSFLSLNISRHIKELKVTSTTLDLPSSLISEFYSGGIISLAKWWVFTDLYVPHEKLMKLINILLESFLQVTTR